MTHIIDILKQSSEYEKFRKNFPDYDIITRTLTESDQFQLRKEYGLFPYTSQEVIAVTLISRILIEKGYPKLKAYIDGEKNKIIHIFLVQ